MYRSHVSGVDPTSPSPSTTVRPPSQARFVVFAFSFAATAIFTPLSRRFAGESPPFSRRDTAAIGDVIRPPRPSRSITGELSACLIGNRNYYQSHAYKCHAPPASGFRGGCSEPELQQGIALDRDIPTGADRECPAARGDTRRATSRPNHADGQADQRGPELPSRGGATYFGSAGGDCRYPGFRRACPRARRGGLSALSRRSAHRSLDAPVSRALSRPRHQGL